jgi:Mn2+/Fe2+ NRAMP family transporter
LRFNFVQVSLAAITVIAVGSLVFFGVRQSLLGSPNMGVTGPGSYGSSFSWFVDRIGSALPQPAIYSAPMWVYRALMFAWALWLVLALLRWLRWGWQAWKTNGIWRGKVAAPSAA